MRYSLYVILFVSNVIGVLSLVANNSSRQSSTQISSQVISRMAEVALKLRLTKQSGVKVDVDAEPGQLVIGNVPFVKVQGRGWASPTGKLTCRRIEASVSDCKLDFKSVITRQKLVLTKPATGTAMVSLTSQDFGNFLTHPLLKPPQLDESQQSFEFSKDGIRIDPVSKEICFSGIYDNCKWRCVLTKSVEGSSAATIKVTPEQLSVDANETLRQVELSLRLTSALSKFFNELIFELDGTFLSYRDLLVTAKGESPSIILALNITVRKFPSPGLAF